MKIQLVHCGGLGFFLLGLVAISNGTGLNNALDASQYNVKFYFMFYKYFH
jgi:hypothetical protein